MVVEGKGKGSVWCERGQRTAKRWRNATGARQSRTNERVDSNPA